MPTQRIQFKEWLPDQPAIGQGLQDALNVVPAISGYAPFPSTSVLSGTATENLNNVFVGKVGDSVDVIAGGDTTLFLMDASTKALSDVSKLYSTASATAYNGNSRWKFVQFGSSVIATDYNSPLQTWDVTGSSRFESLGRYVDGTYARSTNSDTAVTFTTAHGLTIGSSYIFDFTSGASANTDSAVISNAQVKSVARSSGTVTVTTGSPSTALIHGYTVGDTVTIAATTNTSFNGTFTIVTVPTSTTFTYSQTTSNKTISNVARTSNVSTITTSAAHGYAVGYSVTVAATTNTGFNGTFTITGTPTTTTFTYAQVAADVGSTADTGSVILANLTTTADTGSVNNPKAFMITNGSGTTSGNVKVYTTRAPTAKSLAVVRDFVVAANISDTEANKLQWCDIADETNWQSGNASQSDFQFIADGGTIQAITGGEFGIILLEKSIYRMQYVGSPYFFQFDAISRNIGCAEGNSAINSNGITYFLSDDGFYMCDGRAVTPIGAEKIDKYFYANFDVTNSNTMSVAVDPARKIVVWNYPTVDGGRELLVYHWQLQKWTRVETTVNYLAQNSVAAQSGTTLEGLDSAYILNATSLTSAQNGKTYAIASMGTTTTAQWTAIGVVDTAVQGTKFTKSGATGVGTGTVVDLTASLAALKTMDTMPTSLDDRIYAAGKFVFAGASTTSIVTFTGNSLTANIIMSDVEEGYNSVATLVRPLVDNGGASVAIASRRELDDDIQFNSNSVTAGNFVVGQNYVITSIGTTSFTSIGSPSNTIGKIFKATGVGSGTGTADKCSGEGGRISLRSAGRFHRLSITPAGNWTTAVAVDLTLEPQGGR